MYRPTIAQPRVLLVVSHPTVGGGIETLLRLEQRYQVRRATRLAEAVRLAQTWPADVALVDAAMVPPDGRLLLAVPALLLAAGEAENEAAARALDDPRGWVAKDAESGTLVAAVERLLTRAPEAAAGAFSLLVIGALVVVLLALLLYLVWIAVV